MGEGIASKYEPGHGWLGSINELDKKKGYWVTLPQGEAKVILLGEPSDEQVTYDLDPGTI